MRSCFIQNTFAAIQVEYGFGGIV